MKTVGLYPEDTRIYYVSIDFVVMNNPYNGNKPTIIMRHPGSPDMEVLQRLLDKLGFELVGQPWFREDGLWCCEVKEVDS